MRFILATKPAFQTLDLTAAWATSFMHVKTGVRNLRGGMQVDFNCVNSEITNSSALISLQKSS
jgi:hypothetical protein